MRQIAGMPARAGLLLAFVLGITISLGSPHYGQTGLNPGVWSARVEPQQVKPGATAKLLLTIRLEPGWHVYSMNQPPPPRALRIVLEENPHITLAGEIQQPKPKVEFDPNFQIDTQFFEGTATFTVPIKIAPDAPEGAQKIVAKVTSQLCNAERCLPPRTRPYEAEIMIGGALAAAKPSPTIAPSPSASATPSPAAVAATTPSASPSASTSASASPSPATAGAVADGGSAVPPAAGSLVAPNSSSPTVSELRARGLMGYIWLAFGFGLLALVTPCVFPMIPITVSFFTKREHSSHGAAIKQALVYCAGIIVTFTGLGLLLTLLAGPTGINRLAASPWMNIMLTTLFVVFALNLFGLFEIRVPSSLLSRIDARAQSGGSLAATLLMGLTFTLTSFTCTAAFIGTVLVAATQGEWFWSAIGMFAFATAFSLPFFLLAIFPRWLKSLPKSGGWLNSVKVVMGFVELAAAFKFLSNVDLVWGWQTVTRELMLAGWIVIALLIVIYLLGRIRFRYDTPVARLGAVRIGVAVLFLGLAVYLSTGLAGRSLGELEAFLPPRPGHGVWHENYEEALELARASKKPLFLNFTGVTCTNCRWMESNMFTDPEVKRELEKFVLAELFTDRETAEDEKNGLMQETRFKTVALPLYVILDPEGNELAQFPGSTRDRGEFLGFLQAGAARFAQLAERR